MKRCRELSNMVLSLFRSGNRKKNKGSKRQREREDYGVTYDKQWARKYILDPLTAPEPNQETGLGTSHVIPLHLAQAKRDVDAVDRPRRQRKHISVDTDAIDALDTIGGQYHHGGPYDAALLSRNLDWEYSPVAAVEESNMEAIQDMCVGKHRVMAPECNCRH
ncbi:hypothetical protein EsDP_00001220 [Epichloe bromicola]|uniref:Uncharacterized protein n=1 Tax=Epichloe bromicola TaxID=79588 RepID=A0ABQ0CH67_9HYPO